MCCLGDSFRKAARTSFSFVTIALAALAFATAMMAAPGAQTAVKGAAKAEAAMTAFRATTNVAEKLKSLRALESLTATRVDEFLHSEYGKLDTTREGDARIQGAILRIWATRPDKMLLPFLIYEGLFHDDAEVVRACVAGIERAPDVARIIMSTGSTRHGADPAEGLAADLVQRLGERADTVRSLEKVLVLWTGRKREGYDPSVTLKKAPSEKERAAALEFWKGWYEERFKKKLKL